jgi:hypothetical protein
MGSQYDTSRYGSVAVTAAEAGEVVVVSHRPSRRWYAVSGADRAIDPDLQEFMAGRAGSTTVQFDDASHVGGLTHYATRFVKLIEQAVDATVT